MAATTVGGDGNCGGTAAERQPLQPEITKKVRLKSVHLRACLPPTGWGGGAGDSRGWGEPCWGRGGYFGGSLAGAGVGIFLWKEIGNVKVGVLP